MVDKNSFVIAMFINGIQFIIASLIVSKLMNAVVLGWLFLISAIIHFIVAIEVNNKKGLVVDE